MQSRISHQYGFTLIELMVVISVVSLLSSVLLANANTTKAIARDTVRAAEVRQIDNAVQSYNLDVGHAPDLQGNCPASMGASLNSTTVLNCSALSTAAAGTSQANAWTNLMQDLKPYLPSAPVDPCPNCTSGSGLPIGYTYNSPGAVAYTCTQNGTCAQLPSDQSMWYQLYAALEKNSYVPDLTGAGTLYSPGASTPQITLNFLDQGGLLGPTSSNRVLVTASASQFQQCSVTDTLGLVNSTLSPASPNLSTAIMISAHKSDTVTVSCSNYGVAATQSSTYTWTQNVQSI